MSDFHEWWGKIRVLSRATLNGLAGGVVARGPPVAHPWLMATQHCACNNWLPTFRWLQSSEPAVPKLNQFEPKVVKKFKRKSQIPIRLSKTDDIQIRQYTEMSQDLNPNPRTCSSLVIFMYWACERQVSIFLVWRSKRLSGKCPKLHTLAASNNRDHPTRSLYCCLFASHIQYLCVALCAHPDFGESHLQQHPLLLQWTAPIACSFVKVAPGTTFTSWSKHHFVVIGKVERHVRKSSHCGSKQQ